MKRNVLVIAGLAVLSTNAFASKARVEALNQDSVRGSEYISDSRNIFRNPAMLNTMSNYVITEWGSSVTTADDSSAAPRAEGGFFREAGAFNYGLYLGNDGTLNGRNAAFLRQDNALDLFFSGDMGLQWGAKVHYAAQKDETGTFTKKNNAFGLGLGVASGAFDAYIDLTLSDKSEGGTLAADEFKTKPSFIVGGSYAMSGNTFFASYESEKTEEKIGTVTSKVKGNTIIAGAGRVWDINPTAKIFTDAKVVLGSNQAAAPAPKLKTQELPVTIGMEAEATSWLTLRGSVTQNVILNSEETAVAGVAKKKTQSNTTDVAAGATLNFGKLKVDGVIGTTGANRAGGVAAEQGVLATDNLLTRVGVTYMF